MTKIRFAKAALMIPVLGLLAQAACGGEAFAPEFDAATQELQNGTVVLPWSAGGPTEARPVVEVRGSGLCTGTLVKPSWVLTAGHCGLASGANQKVLSRRASGAPVERTVDVVVTAPDRLDMALAHLTSAYSDITPAPIYADTNATLWGQTVNCYGFGATASCSATVACPTGQSCSGGLCFDNNNTPKLRSGALVATKSDWPATVLNVPNNSSNQGILPGDSGGPCMRGGAVTSTHTTSEVDTSAVNLREWIITPSRVEFTTGDFNGDGKADVVVTSAAGSDWYYSTGKGTWNIAYSRPDLAIGTVAYTPGDFDGDGKTDLIITTADGSWWFYGAATPGTFSIPSPILDAEFQLHKQHFVVGDFNGDHRDDFVLVSSVFEPRGGGSFWYYATSTRGTWNQAYSRPDLVLDNVAYTPGDFDGDGKTDLIIATTGGSFWYFGTGTGTWSIPAALIRTDLVLGQVDYVTGNFDGALGTDLIITVPGGSYWYYSNGNRSSWTIPASAVRTDLKLGNVAFTPADFNGDGKTDMIVTRAADSRWYYSTGVGTWNQSYTQAYTRGNVLYKAGNFDGDSAKKADFIATTSTGSYFYYSTGTGTFDHGYTLSKTL